MDEWKRRSTSASCSVEVDIDLDQFNDEQLLQELINRDLLTKDDAVAIMNKQKVARPPVQSANADLMRATDELRCGRRSEALIYIERFLGNEWAGALSS